MSGITNALIGSFAPVSNSYESIQTISVGAGGQTSVTFSSIPATYKHLQIRYIAQLSGGADSSRVTLNGNTGANYAFHQLYGTGSAAVASGGGSANAMNIAWLGNSGIANTFSAGIVDVLDYADTNKNKTLRVLTGVDSNNTNGIIFLNSGLFINTGAVNSFTFGYNGSNTITQYSTFALYGIKG